MVNKQNGLAIFATKYRQPYLGTRITCLCTMRTKRKKCEKCQSCFSYQSQLDHHMITHLDAKPYKCPSKACNGKGFKEKASLDYHMEQHSGELIPCLVQGCTKTFKSRHYRTDHMNNIHGPVKQCQNMLRGCTFTTRAQKTLNDHHNWYCEHNPDEDET